MDNKKYINSGLYWTLTTEAAETLQELLKSGFDYDLAYTLLEDSLSEEAMYDRPLED